MKVLPSALLFEVKLISCSSILGSTLVFLSTVSQSVEKTSPGDLGSANEHFKRSKVIEETY